MDVLLIIRCFGNNKPIVLIKIIMRMIDSIIYNRIYMVDSFDLQTKINQIVDILIITFKINARVMILYDFILEILLNYLLQQINRKEIY